MSCNVLCASRHQRPKSLWIFIIASTRSAAHISRTKFRRKHEAWNEGLALCEAVRIAWNVSSKHIDGYWVALPFQLDRPIEIAFNCTLCAVSWASNEQREKHGKLLIFLRSRLRWKYFWFSSRKGKGGCGAGGREVRIYVVRVFIWQKWRETAFTIQPTRDFCFLHLSLCFAENFHLKLGPFLWAGSISPCNAYMRQHIKGRNITRVSYKFNDLLLVFHVRRLHRLRRRLHSDTAFAFSSTIFVWLFIRHLVAIFVYRAKYECTIFNFQFSFLFCRFYKTRFRNMFSGNVSGVCPVCASHMQSYTNLFSHFFFTTWWNWRIWFAIFMRCFMFLWH